MTLKERSFSAVRWTTAAAVARSVMQLAQVAILARLLSPVDYGLMAIVTVVLNFATIFADLGLTSAYIQKQNVTPVQRSSLFWLNLTMGGFLTLVVLLGSNLIAGFFGDAPFSTSTRPIFASFCYHRRRSAGKNDGGKES